MTKSDQLEVGILAQLVKWLLVIPYGYLFKSWPFHVHQLPDNMPEKTEENY